jgi:ABC-type multidrug transport system permease subunit
MKKIIDITIKDMIQSFRSLFAIMFMFVIPILMTGMFSLMFGGISQDDNGFSLPATDVIIVNKDDGTFPLNSITNEFALHPGSENEFSIGDLIVMALQSNNLDDHINAVVMDDINQAREMVDNQAASVAVIIPPETTFQFMQSQAKGVIEIYQDPTMNIGPEIVKRIVDQTLDSFSGSKIALGITFEQLSSNGISINEGIIKFVVGKYLSSHQESQGGFENDGENQFLNVQNPNFTKNTGVVSLNAISLIMTGMTVFYVFFTGASGAQNILREEKEGTLSRLFTTPTAVATILTGKFLAVGSTILVQIGVLLIVGDLVFGILWGKVTPVMILSLSTLLASSGMGIFLITLVKTERQAGALIGGLVTIMGMMGMLPIFIMGAPNPPTFINVVSHLVPQGWAVEGFQKTMQGGSLREIIPNTIVLLIWAGTFLTLGITRFRNRFS